jgi:hypothetical protein
MEQFGTELDRPEPDAVRTPQSESDQKRFEYWQSQAQIAQAEKEKLAIALAEKSKMDPLIDLIKSDEETFRLVQSRLTAPKRSTQAQLVAPQRPADYSDVEAVTNPESSSFKYRLEYEKFRDQALLSVAQQQQELIQRQEAERARSQQEEAQRQKFVAWKNEVVSKGIADEEFADFFKLVNTATTDDMVEYYRFRQGRSQSHQPMFQVPLGQGGGSRGPAKVQQSGDVGKEVVSFARRM